MLSNALLNFKLPSDPATASAVARVLDWIQANQWADHLEPSRLSLELEDVRPRDLEAALQHLLRHDVLEVRYRVISPITRQIMAKDYDSPVSVDDTLIDALNNQFARTESEIIQVFVEPKK